MLSLKRNEKLLSNSKTKSDKEFVIKEQEEKQVLFSTNYDSEHMITEQEN